MNKIIVCGACILKEGKILLMHRISKDWWEMPGGKCRVGEKMEDCVAREIREELNVDIDIQRHLGFSDFEESGKTYEYHWFETKVLDFENIVIVESDHFDRYEYISFRDLEKTNLSLNMKNFYKKFEKINFDIQELKNEI